MNIILTSVGNFQEYILDNIRQLLLLGNTNIYVIIESSFFGYFTEFSDKIVLVDVSELPDTYNYTQKSGMNRMFRDGFWIWTSARFFYIYECMRKYKLSDVIHLENDVLIYYNVNVLSPFLDKTRMYVPFDSYKRNIASIIYIPNADVLSVILDSYSVSHDDMHNFTKHLSSGIVTQFPIFADYDSKYAEIAFVSTNYDKIPFLFDAAALGQYLGGVDPRNMPGDTRGFVNETTVVKFNEFPFVWSNHMTQTQIYQPFLVVDDELFPIFNLHIHSKQLSNFTSDSKDPFCNKMFNHLLLQNMLGR